jgi:hypothetical protein
MSIRCFPGNAPEDLNSGRGGGPSRGPPEDTENLGFYGGPPKDFPSFDDIESSFPKFSPTSTSASPSSPQSGQSAEDEPQYYGGSPPPGPPSRHSNYSKQYVYVYKHTIKILA